VPTLVFCVKSDDSCPLAPNAEPAIGVLSIERVNVNGPLSRSLQILQTFAEAMLEASFEATAWVQLANPAQ
jgi:hypothetical protein